MKKIKKLLGILALSGMLLTGCKEGETSKPTIKNGDNVNENGGTSDNGVVDSNSGNDAGDNNGENNNNNSNEGNEGGNNSQGYEGGNQSGDNNQGGEGGEGGNNQGGNNQGSDDNQGGQGNGENQGGGNVKTDWDAGEKEIIDSFFYGADVPYMYIDGETLLDMDLNYGYAFKTAPVCTAELLDTYAALFDNDWINLNESDDEEDDEGLIFAPVDSGNIMSAPRLGDALDDADDDDDDYYYFDDSEEEEEYGYVFRTLIPTDAGDRFVTVSLYGEGYDEENDETFVTSDGSCSFVMEIYDPFMYEWPAEDVASSLEDFELTDVVPAFDGAYVYEVDYSLYMFGYVSIYCYSDDTSITTYIEALEELDYYLYDTDDYGYLYYTNAKQEISIAVGYDDEYGSLDIIIGFYYEEENGNTNDDPYDSEKANWSEDEEAVLDTYFHGVDVPYMNIENESFLRYDEEIETAVKTAPNCSKELLASYAELFDDTWEDLGRFDDESDTFGYYYYCYKKTIETEEGTRYAFVRFYGGTYDSYYGDYSNNVNGTGTFVLEIYDLYYYNWPESLVDEYLEYFELTDDVPAYEDADLYETELDLYYEYLAIFIPAPESALATYVDMLDEAGYEYFYTDEGGYDYYTNEAQEISISVIYEEEYEYLDIYLELYDNVARNIPVELDLEGDSLTQDAFGLENGDTNYDSHTAVGESGAEYSGFMASGAGIQIRSKNSTSGIVTTKSGGIIDAIGIVWNANTSDGRKIEIYASNEPFTVEDMYNKNATNVTKVGEVTKDGDISIFDDFDAQYSYVGIRSASGACYLDEIVFSWLNPELM